MKSDSAALRLSQISTIWNLVAQAHGGDATAESAAVAALVERYQSAVYRYLLAAVREPAVADDLFQDFAVRLVRGDFGRADPQRGRFRDYVKTALINLVINHQKKQRKTPAPLPVAENAIAPKREEFDHDQEFLNSWRKALIERTWELMAAGQSPQRAPFFEALRYRHDHPDLSMAELAEALTARLRPEKPFTEVRLRKLLQRARYQFSDLLLDEVVRSLRAATPDDLERELIDLRFHSYCRRALDRRQR